MTNRIFIYGVPGSGKTYISQKMADDLKLPLFEADTLKEALRKLTTKEESPFLFLGTCQAYRYFGELNNDNVVKGLKAVRQALVDRVSQEIQNHDQVVLEGAFLDPHVLKDIGKLVLVVTFDEEQHKNQFFQHREKSEANLEEFKSARMIQDFLIGEAKNLNIEIKENNLGLTKTLNKDRASGIIIQDKKVLFIHRIREDKEYWVFPGGGVEENETIEEALDREIFEELSLIVKEKKFLFKIENAGRFEHHFLILKYEGDPKLGGPEAERMNDKNQYILNWFPVGQLNSINLFPDKAKESVIYLLSSPSK